MLLPLKMEEGDIQVHHAGDEPAKAGLCGRGGGGVTDATSSPISSRSTCCGAATSHGDVAASSMIVFTAASTGEGEPSMPTVPDALAAGGSTSTTDSFLPGGGLCCSLAGSGVDAVSAAEEAAAAAGAPLGDAASFVAGSTAGNGCGSAAVLAHAPIVLGNRGKGVPKMHRGRSGRAMRA